MFAQTLCLVPPIHSHLLLFLERTDARRHAHAFGTWRAINAVAVARSNTEVELRNTDGAPVYVSLSALQGCVCVWKGGGHLSGAFIFLPLS